MPVAKPPIDCTMCSLFSPALCTHHARPDPLMPQRLGMQIRERRRSARVLDYSRGDKGRLLSEVIKSVSGMERDAGSGTRGMNYGYMCFRVIISLLCERGYIRPLAIKAENTVSQDILVSNEDAEQITEGIRQVLSAIYPARISTREARLFMHLHTQALACVREGDWIVRLFTAPKTTEIETKNFLRII